jgi:hypothetical protein
MSSENALRTHTGHKYFKGIEKMPPFPSRSFRISCDFMDLISCDFMGFHVTSWDFMGFHGFPCDLM